jgi:hypothetical protein
MVEVDRLPLVALLIVMLAAAVGVGNYALGRSGVASGDRAASEKSRAFRAAYREAAETPHPLAAGRGRAQGALVGRRDATARLEELALERRVKSQELAARRARLALARQIRTVREGRGPSTRLPGVAAQRREFRPDSHRPQR